jgi:Uma2 family endonuclease
MVSAASSRPYHFSSDEMGCSHLQFEVLRVLVNLLISYFANRLPLHRVAGELNFLLDPADEKRKVVPDLYIMEGEPQGGPKLPSWKFWEHGGKVPTFVLEVVSDAYTKDYTPEEIPARYEELGVQELVRYDPDFSAHRRGKHPRRLLSHFVRDDQGRLVEQEVTGEHVRLRCYPLWLLHRPPYYLRLATGASSDQLTLVPTDAERAQQALALAQAEAERAQAESDRAQAEAERAQAESDRAQAEAERAQAEARRADEAEQELARLRAELARLRAGR